MWMCDKTPIARSATRWRKNKKHQRALKGINQLKIISLNINGISNKLIELTALIELESPDIICIQETKRKPNDPRIRIGNYIIIEKTAQDEANKNGLAICYKPHLKGAINVNRIEDFVIKVQLENNYKEKLKISNCYVPCNTTHRTEMTEMIQTELRKKQTCICLGDFNRPKEEFMKDCDYKNINYWVAEKNSKGSRRTGGKETKTVIDYSVANSDIITEETYLKDWFISDHYAMRTVIKWKPKITLEEPRIVFDRKVMKESAGVRNRIRIVEYSCNKKELTPQECFDTFYNELSQALWRHKCLKNSPIMKSRIRYTRIEKLVEKGNFLIA